KRQIAFIESKLAEYGPLERRDGNGFDLAHLQEALEELNVSLEEMRTATDELERHDALALEAKQELAWLRWRYDELYESAPVGYVDTARAGKILRATRSAASLLGSTPARLQGRLLVGFVAMQHRLAFRQAVNHLARYRAAESLGLRMMSRQGEEREVSVCAT